MADPKERHAEAEQTIRDILARHPEWGPRPPRELTARDRERRRITQRRRRLLRAGLVEWKVIAGGKLRMEVPVKRACQHCGTEFEPRRTTARFCSAKCRVYAARAKARGG